jgi:hypothetical protein
MTLSAASASASTILSGVRNGRALEILSAVLDSIGSEVGTLVTAQEIGYRTLTVAPSGGIWQGKIGRAQALDALSTLAFFGYVADLGSRGPSIVFARTDRSARSLVADVERSTRETLAARARLAA